MPSPPRLNLSSPQRSFSPSSSNHANDNLNYVPINPFLSDNHENFPPLDEELLYADFEDEPEEIFHNTSNVSLNLSIDTLAKIKPVDISNISDFLKEKQQEEFFEENQRSTIEREDSEYFKQRKEDLSPQSKKGKAVVLYSSFMDENNKQIQDQSDNLSFTPRKNYNHMDEEDEEEFSFSSPPQFMSPIVGENRREDFFFSPSKSSPNPGEIDISFLSPIRSSGNSNAPSSPLLTPENKILKSISNVKTKDGELTKKRVSVAKKLDFLQNESPTMEDEPFGNSSLPISKISPDLSNANIQHSSMIIGGTNKFKVKENEKESINTPKKVSFHIVQTTQTTPEDLEISSSTNTSLTSTPTPIRDFSIQSIEMRSIGIQTIVDNTKFSQTSPLHCPNCNHKFTLEHTDSTMLLFPENDSSFSTTSTTTTPYRSSRNINNTSTTLYSTPQSSRSYSHHTSQFSSYNNTPSRYSFPTLVSSRIYTSYHQETHLISEHRKPLSPLNYALVKQRYKTQMRYLDKHSRNSFHLS